MADEPSGKSGRANRRPNPKTTGAPARAGRRKAADAEGKTAGFPVAGIGASAGGIEALARLFEAMPADSGIAFVIVLHLDPTHESRLAEVLGHHTEMPVVEIEDMLQELRCEIVGPVSTVEAAVAAVRQHDLDGALLDMNLHGETVSPAAEELLQRAVPFLLVTGYASRNGDAPVLKDAPRLKKPFSLQSLSGAMTEVFVQRRAE